MASDVSSAYLPAPEGFNALPSSAIHSYPDKDNMLTLTCVTAREVPSPSRKSLAATNIDVSKTFLARLCEQAERYDEMVSYMKEVANVRQNILNIIR